MRIEHPEGISDASDRKLSHPTPATRWQIIHSTRPSLVIAMKKGLKGTSAHIRNTRPTGDEQAYNRRMFCFNCWRDVIVVNRWQKCPKCLTKGFIRLNGPEEGNTVLADEDPPPEIDGTPKIKMGGQFQSPAPKRA